MRRSVPFTEEKLIVRREPVVGLEEHEKLVKELATESNSSSWDELVPNWPTCAGAQTQSFGRAQGNSESKLEPQYDDHQSRASVTKALAAQIEWKPVNNGHCLRISISGKLDLAARKEWQRFTRETSALGIGQFEFNLTRTPELSLAGLGLLLLFKEQKKSQRQDIKLNHCNRRVRELLLWTGMDKYFLIQAKPENEV